MSEFESRLLALLWWVFLATVLIVAGRFGWL
jgi:hypothetical protein